MGGGELYCDICGLPPVVSPDGLLSAPPTAVTNRTCASVMPGGPAWSPLTAATHAAGSPPTERSASPLSSPSSPSSHCPPSPHSSNSSRPPRSSHPSPRSSSASRSSPSRRSVSGRLSRSLSGGEPTRGMASVPVSVRSAGSGSGAGSGRGRLGAGLVTVPEVPRPDPRTAVLENPEVPERKRFCSRGECGAPVGRSRGERPGRTEGFCAKCGHPYSFVPKLRPGDLVHGQYEVVGCLAHGGLGWIYLATDRAVSDRWVVLKGLLDTGDEEALAAAVSERRFLAEIEHSNIVRIYNFVEHLDPSTGSLDGYIVMEYVGGTSLKDIANGRRTPQGRRDPLPVEQACAYGIEALEALGHLHSRNLLYCDFKVDNAIQQDDRLKLIDMGAVRRRDDHESPIYGTIGYQAPEVAELGPSVASDLYTVARTLAVLTFDFQGYTNVFADSLPDPDNIEVFRTYESFYRLLVRATDPDRARRFASAEEMAEQLTGVLREVVALQTGEQRPSLSVLFGPELRVVDTELVAAEQGDGSLLGARTVHRGRRARAGSGGVTGQRARAGSGGVTGQRARAGSGGVTGRSVALEPTAAAAALPGRAAYESEAAGGPDGPGRAAAAPGGPALRPLDTGAAALTLPAPRVDPADPNAGFLAGLMSAGPGEVIAALRSAPADSLETRLRALRAHLETGEAGAAREALQAIESQPGEEWGADWRVVWNHGLVSLTAGDHESAALSFDAVYDAFPGEAAPKLALAVCAELLGQLDNATEYYRLVWATDHSYVSAAFGLARVRLATGDRPGAVEALESVPESSIHYTAARIAAVRARLRRRSPHDPLLPDLRAAAEEVEALADFGLDAERREHLTTEVLGSALDWVLSGCHGARPDGGHAPQGRPALLGSTLDERGLRFGLERSYRLLARLAERGDERIELVERANRFRPRTWV
ncbi:serine/threonine-protein kinase PknG [Streptomyces halobius]|uniref:non-specific serine/threonine protein kinase n=1 Tax=Streptomyces halobius TaxID=2879846 RepID=A0ABY4MJK7_9ACTN|nr:serine/threonine-protein kinase [Streptomyces halobius]UQA97985.1 serine/threonine-protein kinase PknG [Streptomyces halobius]